MLNQLELSREQTAFFMGIPEPKPLCWTVTTKAGLMVLCGLWALLFAGTWARWGNVTVDCGREMYVPWELSQGKTLYKDIWYLYTPLGPYLNSFLFRLFGAKLAVLYWAGSLSAFGSSILLYLIGIRLSSWKAGWTAAAIVLVEAFAPSLHCFPLPYSFGAVYGALATALCFWCCTNAAFSSSWVWVFGGASAAALALLAKVEFGIGCYVAVGVLILARSTQARSVRTMLTNLLTTLPGLVACGVTLVWMISLGGAEFLIQGNLMGLPSTYFMKVYGATWLRFTGMAFDRPGLLRGLGTLVVFLLYFAVPALFKRYGTGWRVFLAGLAPLLVLSIAMVLVGWPAILVARALFLPPGMVFLLFVAIPPLLAKAWRTRFSAGSIALVVLVSGTATVAMRCMFLTNSIGYSIFYNGPVILSFLLLVGWVTFPEGPHNGLWSKPAELLPYVAVLLVACVPIGNDIIQARRALEPLQTDRGVIYLHVGMPPQYKAAIQLMKDAAKEGKYVLSIPEDTSLYFLAGAHCPTRVFAFTPGATAPGKAMERVIAEISNSHTQYLIWAQRNFHEYGTPTFGKDFDQQLGDYFRSHYRPLASLPKGWWDATVWERKMEVYNP